MNTGNRLLVRQDIVEILSDFNTISLKEMGQVHLMSRFDMKYVFSLNSLPALLEELKNDYESLMIDDLKLFRYENLYFDSPDLKSYHDHHNGKSFRFKVRFRRYSDSSNCYFEIKLKNNKGLTEKSRLPCDEICQELSEPQLTFLKTHLNGRMEPLVKQITNNFSRITLVNEKRRERVTIDLLIDFKNGASEKSLDELVIAEVKQEQPSYKSAFKKLMQKQRVFPTSISKYCLGTMLTHPGIKYNRFKPKLIILNKICNGVD